MTFSTRPFRRFQVQCAVTYKHRSVPRSRRGVARVLIGGYCSWRTSDDPERENPQLEGHAPVFGRASQLPLSARSGSLSGGRRMQGMISKRLLFLTALLLGWACTGCSSVHVVRLTSETFPPRAVDEVEILSQAPSTEHVRIAELSETSTTTVDTLQRHLLKKAAQLGAQAVVFSAPTTRIEDRVAYQPVYSPWGYYAPSYYGPGPYGYWGPWGYRYGPWGPGWGYPQYVPMPYSVRVTTLKGIAIRYSGS